MFWLGLISAVAFIPGYVGASIPTSWAVLSCVLPFVLWNKVRIGPTHWALVAFVLFAFVSLAWTPSIYDGIGGLWQVGIFALAFILGSSEEFDAKGLFKGAGLGLSASVGVACLQYFGIEPVMRMDSPYFAGLQFNSMAQGEALALVILGVWCFNAWRSLIPFLLVGLYLSHSRGAWAALLFGLFAHITRKHTWLIILGLVTSIFLYFSHQADDASRLQFWEIAATHLIPRGWGVGSWTSVFILQGTGGIHPEYVHNDYLQLVFEFGAASTLVFAIFAAGFASSATRGWPILVAFLCMAAYSFPLHTPLVLLYGTCAAGLGCRRWNYAWLDFTYRRYDFIRRRPVPWRPGVTEDRGSAFPF